jgi:hypothetical protein
LKYFLFWGLLNLAATAKCFTVIAQVYPVL